MIRLDRHPEFPREITENLGAGCTIGNGHCGPSSEGRDIASGTEGAIALAAPAGGPAGHCCGRLHVACLPECPTAERLGKANTFSQPFLDAIFSKRAADGGRSL